MLSVKKEKCGIDPCAPGAPQGCLKFSSATQRVKHFVLSPGKNTLTLFSVRDGQRKREGGKVGENKRGGKKVKGKDNKLDFVSLRYY